MVALLSVGCGPSGQSIAPTTQAATATAAPTMASAAPSQSHRAVGVLQPLPSVGAIDAGTYVVSNPASSWERSGNDEDGYTSSDPCFEGCADYMAISFTVPDGWATRDGLV